MSTFWVFSAAVFASGFALRLVDPLVLPIAAHYAVTPERAALLSTAYALPYAVAQLFLGPLGDRIGKLRCMQLCGTGLMLALLAGLAAPSFGTLFASRVVAGCFAGGLIPLVLASLGDRYALAERQVAIGRMLFAIIAGQMMGSVVAGLANAALGWRSALAISAAISVLAALLLWRERAPAAAPAAPASARALYALVFRNPAARWLYLCAVVEGALFFGLFPYMGALLQSRDSALGTAQAGLVLGAFGVGGLLYAMAVRRLVASLGALRMCRIGALAAAACYAASAFLSPWWLLVPAMLLAGFAFYMIHNALQVQVSELAPAARGSATALFACAFFAGQGVGPLLLGPLIRQLGMAWSLVLIGAGLLGLGWVVLRRVLAPAAQARAALAARS